MEAREGDNDDAKHEEQNQSRKKKRRGKKTDLECTDRIGSDEEDISEAIVVPITKDGRHNGLVQSGCFSEDGSSERKNGERIANG